MSYLPFAPCAALRRIDHEKPGGRVRPRAQGHLPVNRTGTGGPGQDAATTAAPRGRGSGGFGQPGQDVGAQGFGVRRRRDQQVKCTVVALVNEAD